MPTLSELPPVVVELLDAYRSYHASLAAPTAELWGRLQIASRRLAAAEAAYDLSTREAGWTDPCQLPLPIAPEVPPCP